MDHLADRLTRAADNGPRTDRLTRAADMDDLADGLDRAADTLTTIDRRMPTLAIDAVAFAADDAGVPGRLGRELHEHWSAVIEARSHEVAALAARLSDTAASVRATARHYTETDDAAGRRIAREA